MPRYTKTITICDRCNKTIEDDELNYANPKSYIPMWMSFQSFNCDRKYMNGNATHFLCKDCEKEFIDWFTEDKDYIWQTRNS